MNNNFTEVQFNQKMLSWHDVTNLICTYLARKIKTYWITFCWNNLDYSVVCKAYSGLKRPLHFFSKNLQFRLFIGHVSYFYCIFRLKGQLNFTIFSGNLVLETFIQAIRTKSGSLVLCFEPEQKVNLEQWNF